MVLSWKLFIFFKKFKIFLVLDINIFYKIKVFIVVLILNIFYFILRYNI